MIDPKRVRPPHVALGLLILAIGIHVLLKPERLILPPFHWLGLLFGSDGLFLMVWARRLFPKNKTPVRHDQASTHFVREGPYRVSRNPMYVGGIMLFFGMAIFVGTWPFIAFPLLMFLILDRIYIPWEEEAMLNQFGDEYQKYLDSTRRWL